MTNERNMEIVDPNDYEIIQDYEDVKKGDYITDHDGNELAVVLGWDNDNLICRNLETGKKFIVTEDNAQHLGYGYKRQNPTKTVPISDDLEKQIAECLRLAGVK